MSSVCYRCQMTGLHCPRECSGVVVVCAFSELEITESEVCLKMAVSVKFSLLYLFLSVLSGSFGSSPLEDADPAVPIWQLQTAPAGKQLCLHYNPTGWSVCYQDTVSYHTLFPIISCFCPLHLISSDKLPKDAKYVCFFQFIYFISGFYIMNKTLWHVLWHSDMKFCSI